MWWIRSPLKVGARNDVPLRGYGMIVLELLDRSVAMAADLNDVLMDGVLYRHCMGAVLLYYAWGIISLLAILQPPLQCFFLFHVSPPTQH